MKLPSRKRTKVIVMAFYGRDRYGDVVWWARAGGKWIHNMASVFFSGVEREKWNANR